MQPLPGGIGKLDQSEIFGLVRAVLRVEDPGLLPGLLPFGLHSLVVIFHLISSFLIKLRKSRPARGPGGRRKTPDAHVKHPGRKIQRDFRGTTRDFRTRTRAFPHSLHQGWAYNAAARPTPTKRWQAAPLGRETQGPVYAPRRLPACTTRRLSERRLRRLLPVIVFSYFPL